MANTKPPRLRADAMPKEHLTSRVIISVTRMSNLLRRYDAREMWGSELLFGVLGSFEVMTAQEKSDIIEYFRKCGNWKPIQEKGQDDAKGNIHPKKGS